MSVQVIICTDGLANKGVGNLDGKQKNTNMANILSSTNPLKTIMMLVTYMNWHIDHTSLIPSPIIFVIDFQEYTTCIMTTELLFQA